MEGAGHEAQGYLPQPFVGQTRHCKSSVYSKRSKGEQPSLALTLPRKAKTLGKGLALCHSFHAAAGIMGPKEGQPPVVNNKGAAILWGALESSGWVLRAIPS